MEGTLREMERVDGTLSDTVQMNRVLLDVARGEARAYGAHTAARAVMLVGSTAIGATDAYSDLDLVAYYDAAPSDQQLDAARVAIGAEAYTRPGPHVENYQLAGIECQVGHFLSAEFERRLATVLEGADPESSVHTELMGLVTGVPLHGSDLIAGWQKRARAFLERLRVTMTEHYLSRIYPL